MCSSTRGPASVPSLVTWPIITTATPSCFDMRVSCAAHSRTCATDPGADCSLFRIEGLDRIDHDHGRAMLLDRRDDPLERDLGQQRQPAGIDAEPARAQRDLRRRTPRR